VLLLLQCSAYALRCDSLLVKIPSRSILFQVFVGGIKRQIIHSFKCWSAAFAGGKSVNRVMTFHGKRVSCEDLNVRNKNNSCWNVQWITTVYVMPRCLLPAPLSSKIDSIFLQSIGCFFVASKCMQPLHRWKLAILLHESD